VRLENIREGSFFKSGHALFFPPLRSLLLFAPEEARATSYDDDDNDACEHRQSLQQDTLPAAACWNGTTRTFFVQHQ